MVQKATIGRTNGELKTFPFEDGETIQTLLNKAGLTLAQGEEVHTDEEEVVSLSDKVEDGMDYYIVRNSKNA